MVSEPIPVRQYSGNAALNRIIAPVKEAHGEEEEAERSERETSARLAASAATSHFSSPSASAAAHREPSVLVKNTFIDFGPGFDDSFDAGVQEILHARQCSEPAFQRQLSGAMMQMAAQMAVAAVPEHAMLDVTGHGKEMPTPEEPETEIEPQMQGDEHQWANYVAGPESMATYGVAFSSNGLMYPQQGLEFYQGATPVLMGGDSEAVERNDPLLPAEWANVYTVMMRNLPNRYTQRMLLDEICSGSAVGTFDFLYLPVDPNTNANKGYAFINFLEPSFAWHFKCIYEGKQMGRFNSSKFVSVSPAALQGLEANYAHYSTSRCSRGDPAARPLFLREPAPSTAGRTRRGGRRRLQDVSLVDIAAKSARQAAAAGAAPTAKPEAKALPSGQVFGLGMAAPRQAGPKEAAKSGRAAQATGGAARFCPYCGGACKPEFKFCQFCGASLDVLQNSS